TSARANSPRLTPLPEPTAPEAARELIMTPGEAEMRRPPPPPRPSASATSELMAQLARARPAAEPPATDAPKTAPDYDALLAEVLADPEAPYRSVAVLYQDFLVHCRAHGVNGRALDLNNFRRRLAVARAGVATAAADSPEWEQAMAAAGGLPEDLQGVFLLLARAAHDGTPCPSDADIARARGTRSARRARGLLGYMEGRGLVAPREDAFGMRVISLPTLGWETAPGDPNAGGDGED
ncbi:MAG: ATP-binding protein, partial [Actinomycetota bacterium]